MSQEAKQTDLIQFIADLQKKSISFSVVDGSLKIKAPKGAVSPEILSEIKLRKQQLLELIESNKSSQRIQPATFSDRRPINASQKQMLMLEQFAGASSQYVMVALYKVDGDIDESRLARAFIRLMDRHDALRSNYFVEGAEVWQSLVSIPEVNDFLSVTCVDAYDESQLDELSARLQKPFALNHDLPVRVELLKSGSSSILGVGLHHIVADGASVGVLVRDLCEAYNRDDFLANIGEEPRLTSADFAAYQKLVLNDSKKQTLLDYWTATLEGAPVLHSFPSDRPRAESPLNTGRVIKCALDDALVGELKRLAGAQSATVFTVLQAALTALIARYSGSDDVVIGTVVSGRERKEFAGLVAMLANTLPLRHRLVKAVSIRDHISECRNVAREAMLHQQLPFEDIVLALNPTRGSFNPLVQIVLIQQEQARKQLNLDGCVVTAVDNNLPTTKFDLALHYSESDESFELEWEYSTELFDSSTLARVHTDFVCILKAFVSNDALALAEIELASAPKLPQVAAYDQSPARPIFDWVLEQAQLYPDRTAIEDSEESLSYRNAVSTVDKIVAILRNHKVQQGDRVGVCGAKDRFFVLSMLAIYRLGAVYVPLDKTYPAERIRYMVEDCQLALTLADESVCAQFSADKIQANALCLRDELEKSAGSLRGVPESSIDLDSTAYIIYTSGSTGKPKGVEVSHRALSLSLFENAKLMSFCSSDIMPALGSEAFGVSLLEFLLPLCHGAKTRLVVKREVQDMDSLVQKTSGATVVHMVPSLAERWIHSLSEADIVSHYSSLRILLVGGEPVSKKLLKSLNARLSHVRVVELYGMTESAVVCCSYEPQPKDNYANFCIGSTHPHMRALVLNAQMKPQPISVAGELYLSGPSLATRYLNQPEQTVKAFVDLDGLRLYKTGDRARVHVDGNLEFLGRTDNQLSLRGMRVELSEIEGVINEHASVKKAVVSVQGESQVLIAFVTSYGSSLTELQIDDIKQLAGCMLPEHMCPTFFVQIESLPLNPNGKIDRKALPELDLQSMTAADFVAPETEVEIELAQMWAQELGLDSVGTNDNFFELGGHSLMATKIVSDARARWEVELSILELFESPNVGAIAKRITDLRSSANATTQGQQARVTKTKKREEKTEFVF